MIGMNKNKCGGGGWHMKPDEQEIRKVHSNWIEAINAGNLDRLLTLMAGDVVFLNPGSLRRRGSGLTVR